MTCTNYFWDRETLFNSKMTYNVPSGTLNHTIPYCTILGAEMFFIVGGDLESLLSGVNLVSALVTK